MTKKNAWTPERRAAASAAAKARLAKPDEPKASDPDITTATQPVIEQKETIANSDDYNELKKQVQELKDLLFSQVVGDLRSSNPNGISVGSGKVLGSFEKYALSKDLYPDPVERLKKEQKLARFAFPMNYDLEFQVTTSEYTTIDGIRTKEPKFALTLIRIVLDEETGEDTGGRYEICRLIMHEDPEAAMVIARDNGLEVEADDETTFLNEMRYIRMRDWLLESFYPAPVSKKRDKREMVIGGKLVNYYEVNNEDGRGVMKQNWDNLPRIKF